MIRTRLLLLVRLNSDKPMSMLCTMQFYSIEKDVLTMVEGLKLKDKAVLLPSSSLTEIYPIQILASVDFILLGPAKNVEHFQLTSYKKFLNCLQIQCKAEYVQ